VLDEGDWHTHLSITGHVGQMREDADLTGIDRLARQYIGKPYPRFDRSWISAWIAVDGWHGWARSRTVASRAESLPDPS